MKFALRWALVSSTVAAVLLLAGCSFSFSTANISEFIISKTEGGAAATGTFAPGDTIYAKTTISNSMDKVTVKFHLFAEKVAGKADHTALPEGDLSFDLPSAGNVKYTLTPPAGGWPDGTYTIVTSMVNDQGAEKDTRSGTFTVAGGASTAAASAATSATAPGTAPPAATPSSAPATSATPSDAKTASIRAEFTDPQFSDSKQGTASDSFDDDTAEIFAHTEFQGVAAGSKVSAEWYVESSDSLPANTKIDVTGNELTVGANDSSIDFGVRKPDKGWPVGTYRVEISVNGKRVTKGTFDIED